MSKRIPSSRLPLFSIRLPPATKSRWREAAERDGRTLAGYIKHAVEQFLCLSPYVWYCVKCDRWQDYRTGCEADVRFDERELAARAVEDVGCLCLSLFWADQRIGSTFQFDGEIKAGSGNREIARHDSRCPLCTAEKIRRGNGS